MCCALDLGACWNRVLWTLADWELTEEWSDFSVGDFGRMPGGGAVVLDKIQNGDRRSAAWLGAFRAPSAALARSRIMVC